MDQLTKSGAILSVDQQHHYVVKKVIGSGNSIIKKRLKVIVELVTEKITRQIWPLKFCMNFLFISHTFVEYMCVLQW